MFPMNPSKEMYQRYLRDGKYAKDECPICHSYKVSLYRGGLSWKCENCGMKMGRSYRYDVYGRNLLNRADGKYRIRDAELREKWLELTNSNPDKKYWVRMGRVEEVVGECPICGEKMTETTVGQIGGYMNSMNSSHGMGVHEILNKASGGYHYFNLHCYDCFRRAYTTDERRERKKRDKK